MPLHWKPELDLLKTSSIKNIETFRNSWLCIYSSDSGLSNHPSWWRASGATCLFKRLQTILFFVRCPTDTRKAKNYCPPNVQLVRILLPQWRKSKSSQRRADSDVLLQTSVPTWYHVSKIEKTKNMKLTSSRKAPFDSRILRDRTCCFFKVPKAQKCGWRRCLPTYEKYANPAVRIVHITENKTHGDTRNGCLLQTIIQTLEGPKMKNKNSKQRSDLLTQRENLQMTTPFHVSRRTIYASRAAGWRLNHDLNNSDI